MLGSPRICRILPLGDSESAGKIEIGRPDTGFTLPRPAIMLQKIRLCSEVLDFPRTSAKHGSTERPEAKTATKSAGNSPLNAKTAFRRFPRTKPDVPSQGLITTRTLRKSPIPINHYSHKGQPWGAKPKYLRTSGTSRMSLIRVLAVIDCCDTPFSQREAVGFETPNSDSNSC